MGGSEYQKLWTIRSANYMESASGSFEKQADAQKNESDRKDLPIFLRPNPGFGGRAEAMAQSGFRKVSLLG